MMIQQRSDENQGVDEQLLLEYKHFLSGKAEGTIDAYVRSMHHVMEWVAQCPGNGGYIHPQQLTRTAVEVYLTFLEQQGFSLNHRARVKSTISSFARWLIEEKGLLQRNPTRGVDLPSQQVLAPRQLTEDQRYILRSLVEQEEDRRSAAIFALGNWAGCRVNKVSWLQMAQRKGYFRVAKGATGMFIIKFVTEKYAPGPTVVLRNSVENWVIDRAGEYTDGAWTFELDEQLYPQGFTFKFVIPPSRWMLGDNLQLEAQPAGSVVSYDETQVAFSDDIAVVTEHGVIPQRLFTRNLDPNHVYEVIVVGTGIGGGLLASTLADAGADVLVLEAGSYLFPTHVGNLARRLLIGQFDKHVWSLWQFFKVINYVNTANSQFKGTQAFNLGGRSLFWGGLIPRQAPWQLAAWPSAVQNYLLQGGYSAAEIAFNKVPPAVSAFQNSSRLFLDQIIAGFDAVDAPMAIQYSGFTPWSLPAGMFSTVDLLIEDLLVQEPHPASTNRKPPTVNLNHAVWKVLIDENNPKQVIGVQCYDLLAQEQRSYKGKAVVLCAGTIESAKIALQSKLSDPAELIGKGITDHMIRYRHFTVPPGHPQSSTTDSAKILLQHPQATVDQHAFDIVVELGADFNQGRYIDPNNLAQERKEHNGWMLCEIVFQYYSELMNGNSIAIGAEPANPVAITMQPTAPSGNLLAEADAIAQAVFKAFNASPVLGEPVLNQGLQVADLGGVAHEVGTLRMTDGETGVVNSDLKFLEYDNLYACDNSVFPASPAANPSLTLASLALRLASHLST